MLDAWRALDWDQVVNLFAEDGALYNITTAPIVGREGLRNHLQDIKDGLTRVEFDVRNIGVVNGVVMIERVDEFDFRGHHASVPVYGSMEIENGVVTVWREYFDHAQMRKGMGLE